MGAEKAKEMAETEAIERYVTENQLDTTVTSEQVENPGESENEEEEEENIEPQIVEKEKTPQEIEEIELARLVIELIKIRTKFNAEIDKIYRENEFDKYHPALKDIEVLDSVPVCPTTCVAVPRKKGKTGPTAKTKPRCDYCAIILASKYEEYDHMLKHLQMYKVDCPIEDCDHSFGCLESLRRHLNVKHKKNLSVMEKKEPDLWKKARTPTPCTKDKPYHCEVLKTGTL